MGARNPTGNSHVRQNSGQFRRPRFSRPESTYAHVCVPAVRDGGNRDRRPRVVAARCRWRSIVRRAKPAPGENYHIEASLGWWNADPSLLVSSESLGIPGDDIDLINDLSVISHKLAQAGPGAAAGQEAPLPLRVPADQLLRRHGDQAIVRLQRPALHHRAAGQDDGAVQHLALRLRVRLPLPEARLPRRALRPQVHRRQRVAREPADGQPEFTSAVAPIPTIGIVGRGYISRRSGRQRRGLDLPRARQPRQGPVRRQLHRRRLQRDLQLQPLHRRRGRVSAVVGVLRVRTGQRRAQVQRPLSGRSGQILGVIQVQLAVDSSQFRVGLKLTVPVAVSSCSSRVQLSSSN